MRNFTEAYRDFPQFKEPVRDVMSAMGEAMWHFAQIKEIIWYEAGYEHVKEFFHLMEHSYGDHIDALKALLSQVGLPLIYPTIQGMPEQPLSLEDCFNEGIKLIDRVNTAISELIEVTDDRLYEPLARQAENIQMENYRPRAVMLQARTMAQNEGSATSFDNWFEKMAEDMIYG